MPVHAGVHNDPKGFEQHKLSQLIQINVVAFNTCIMLINNAGL